MSGTRDRVTARGPSGLVEVSLGISVEILYSPTGFGGLHLLS